MTLVARDDGGNEGRSEPHEVRLPRTACSSSRLARALIEQRRKLALDTEARGDVLMALDAMAIGAGTFQDRRRRLSRAADDLSGRSAAPRATISCVTVVARLWSMAVPSRMATCRTSSVRCAPPQEALRQALERGASDEELKKLMDQLRAALDRFMQALAEQMRRNPQQHAGRSIQNTRVLRPQDLRSMLDQMEKLARSGNRDGGAADARSVAADAGKPADGAPGLQPRWRDDMNSALDQLGDMIRRQQQLRDRTFREGQDQRRTGKASRANRGRTWRSAARSTGIARPAPAADGAVAQARPGPAGRPR